MPDLDLVPTWTCCTNVEWHRKVQSSKGDKTYIVSYGLLDSKMQSKLMCTHGYSCTCPSFKFSKKNTCKHIEQVREERCGWNAVLEPTARCAHDSEGQPCCPECGGPVTSFRVGV